MHEASAAEALVRLVTEELRARAASPDEPLPRVARVRLVAGEATGYMEESLAFYVKAYGAGTPVESAALDVAYVKPRFRCSSCGEEYERKRFSFDCPRCGGHGELLSDGSEFYIDSIEIEE